MGRSGHAEGGHERVAITVPTGQRDMAGLHAVQRNRCQVLELFAINAKCPYFTVRKLAPLMPAGSAVVFTTSVANVKALPMVSVYAATKAALRSMTRSLAHELLHRDIRVNAISLGPINTPILERTLPTKAAADQAAAGMRANNPMQRFGRPEEVAEAVAFLAFDATHTTGAELTVDGGVSQL